MPSPLPMCFLERCVGSFAGHFLVLSLCFVISTDLTLLYPRSSDRHSRPVTVGTGRNSCPQCSNYFSRLVDQSQSSILPTNPAETGLYSTYYPIRRSAVSNLLLRTSPGSEPYNRHVTNSATPEAASVATFSCSKSRENCNDTGSWLSTGQ